MDQKWFWQNFINCERFYTYVWTTRFLGVAFLFRFQLSGIFLTKKSSEQITNVDLKKCWCLTNLLWLQTWTWKSPVEIKLSQQQTCIMSTSTISWTNFVLIEHLLSQQHQTPMVSRHLRTGLTISVSCCSNLYPVYAKRKLRTCFVNCPSHQWQRVREYKDWELFFPGIPHNNLSPLFQWDLNARNAWSSLTKNKKVGRDISAGEQELGVLFGWRFFVQEIMWIFSSRQLIHDHF